MRWLKALVICVLAGLFAASGVYKATDRDAGSWQVAHGIFRVVFGGFVIGGAVWQAVRRPTDPPAGPDTGPACDEPEKSSGSQRG